MTCHSQHAMSKECSIEHFDKLVGFTMPSETWTFLMCYTSSSLSRRKNIEMLYWYSKMSVYGTICVLFAVQKSNHAINLIDRLKEPQYAPLEYFIMQANCMLMEYGEKIESTYFNIPLNIRNIMVGASKYTVDFDNNASPPSERVRCSKLMMKGSMEDVEVEESPQEESSVEGGEDCDEEFKGSDEDEEVADVPQEDDNDLVMLDPKEITLIGCLLGN